MNALDLGTPSIRVIAINVGDQSTSDTGISGYLDKVVTVIKNGTDTHTETYDFEAAEQKVTPLTTSTHHHHSSGRSGGSVLGVSTTTEGQVLGASCSPILTSYLGIGKPNPTDQVIVLQNFLNGNLGIALPVTGFFGPLTFQAVKDFQTKYFAEILTPWVPYGLPTEHTPTGYVYKTTQWMINHIACEEADPPKPNLP
jgi:peptidoglycan hydrolase-like protein with peptidoglycan-binding domain